MVSNTRLFLSRNALPDLDKRFKRTDKCIEKMFCYEITHAVHKLNACLFLVHQRQLTVSSFDEDLLITAVALFNNNIPYAGIRREEESIQCLYNRELMYLRHFPKLSLEAAIEAIKDMGYTVHGDAGLASDSDDDPSAGRKLSAPDSGWAGHAVVTKAGKAAQRRDARESADLACMASDNARVAEAHTDALLSLANSSAKQNSILKDQNEEAFRSQPLVGVTLEGAWWLRLQLRLRLKAMEAAANGAGARGAAADEAADNGAAVSGAAANGAAANGAAESAGEARTDAIPRGGSAAYGAGANVGEDEDGTASLVMDANGAANIGAATSRAADHGTAVEGTAGNGMAVSGAAANGLAASGAAASGAADNGAAASAAAAHRAADNGAAANGAASVSSRPHASGKHEGGQGRM